MCENKVREENGGIILIKNNFNQIRNNFTLMQITRLLKNNSEIKTTIK